MKKILNWILDNNQLIIEAILFGGFIYAITCEHTTWKLIMELVAICILCYMIPYDIVQLVRKGKK